MSIMIGGLDQRLDVIQSELQSAESTLEYNSARERARQNALDSRVLAAEARAQAAAEAKVSCEQDKEDSAVAKDELYQTCQRLVKQLQTEQRQVQALRKDRDHAKLIEDSLKSEKDELSAQLTKAWDDNQVLVNLNNDLAAELKAQAIALAMSSDAVAGPPTPDHSPNKLEETSAAKTEELESRAHELTSSIQQLHTKLELKDDELQLAYEGISRREAELNDLKAMVHRLQEDVGPSPQPLAMQLPESDVDGAVLPQGWTKRFSRTKSKEYYQHVPTGRSQWFRPVSSADAERAMSPLGSDDTIDSLKMSLENAKKRAGQIEEDARAASEKAEKELHTARERCAAYEKQSAAHQEQYIVLQQQLQRTQDQLEQTHKNLVEKSPPTCLECTSLKQDLAQLHTAALKAEAAAETALTRFRITEARYQELLARCDGDNTTAIRSDTQEQAERIRQLSEALGIAEQEIDNLSKTVEHLTIERDQQTRAWRDISGEVNRLRSQIVFLTGEDATIGNGDPDQRAPNDDYPAGRSYGTVFKEQWPPSFPSYDMPQYAQGINRGPDHFGSTWCSADKDFSDRGGNGRSNRGDSGRAHRRSVETNADPLNLFASFNFADSNFPFPWAKSAAKDGQVEERITAV